MAGAKVRSRFAARYNVLYGCPTVMANPLKAFRIDNDLAAAMDRVREQYHAGTRNRSDGRFGPGSSS